MVGVRGFEPPASASRTQRSSQTEPHPDLRRKLELSFKFVYIIYHGFLRLQAFFSEKRQNFLILLDFYRKLYYLKTEFEMV